jgi:hypothetical protein
MPIRTITVDGASWRVAPSGLLTANNRDEFGLLFVQGEGENKVTRVTRYSPMTARSREQSFAELSDAELVSLFRQSQPSATSPETHYSR